MLALRQTLQQQGLQRPHIIGHSMGALLAMAYAARYSNKVGCVVLLALPWLMPLMPHVLRDVPAEVARDVLRHNSLSYSRTLKHLIIGLRPAALLPQTKATLLIVQGLKDETALVGPVALGIAGHANARLQTIDAGHHMVFTHAQLLADGIRDFRAP